MAREIEMKAWVEDPDTLQALLDSRCEFLRSYRKSDLYLQDGREHPVRKTEGKTEGNSGGGAPAGEEREQMRLREDDGRWVVTFKDKQVKDGVELNREEEFEVADPEAVEAVARRLGFEELVRKVKIGKQYREGPALYEMSFVEELGWFLEIEILLEDDASEEEVSKTEEDIRRRFRALRIPPEKVEARYYTDLLREADGGKA